MNTDPNAAVEIGRNEPSSLFSEFFGDRPEEEGRRDFRLSHETFNLPDAYKGKNQHLEDVLDFLIRKEDEFYTERLLPWHYTDDIHVQWEIFRFNRTLMDVEPEQGVPRLVTAETERRTDNLLRRGLAFIIEHGFMTTERGRKHFMLNLQQITDAVHTTAHFGVMHALLTSRAHYKEWRRTHSRLGKKTRNLLKHERDTWALVQKTPKGIHILDALMKHEMKRNGVVPDVWVFPPKMSIYLDMVPDEATTYSHRGQLALNNLEEDRSLKGIRWRGTDVFEAQSFDIDFDYGDTDLMNRAQSCGEFFVIPHGTRSIKIFSADHDSWQEISYEQAFNASLGTESIGEPDTDYSKFSNQHVHYNKDTQEKILALEAKINAQFEIQLKDAKNKAGGSKKYNKSKGSLQLADTEFPGLQQVIELSKDLHTLLNERTKKSYSGFFKSLVAEVRPTAAKLKEFMDKNKLELTLLGDDTKILSADKIREKIAKKKGKFETEFKAADELLEEWITAQKAKPTAPVDPAAVATAKEEFIKSMTKALNTCKEIFVCIVYLREELSVSKYEDIILFRPFQTYRMSSAVLAASGEELGSTFHGHHDFQLSDDIIRKVHLGHYTHYSKSVVKQPKRKSIAENVFAQGYVCGEGVEFFTLENLQDELQDVTYKESKKSLIAWKVTAGVTNIRERTALSITGKFPDYLGGEVEEGKDIHFENADQLDAILRSCSLDENPHNGEYLDNGHGMNTVCFRGMQFDGTTADKEHTGKFVCTSLSHGHWKGLTYPGCMAVREGMMMNPPLNIHEVTLGQPL